MSLLWRAVQVDLIARRKGVCAYAWVRCRYGVYNSGCRVQYAGARRVSNAQSMRGIVRKRDCALPAQYTKHSNARGHSLTGPIQWKENNPMERTNAYVCCQCWQRPVDAHQHVLLIILMAVLKGSCTSFSVRSAQSRLNTRAPRSPYPAYGQRESRACSARCSYPTRCASYTNAQAPSYALRFIHQRAGAFQVPTVLSRCRSGGAGRGTNPACLPNALGVACISKCECQRYWSWPWRPRADGCLTLPGCATPREPANPRR